MLHGLKKRLLRRWPWSIRKQPVYEGEITSALLRLLRRQNANTESFDKVRSLANALSAQVAALERRREILARKTGESDRESPASNWTVLEKESAQVKTDLARLRLSLQQAQADADRVKSAIRDEEARFRLVCSRVMAAKTLYRACEAEAMLMAIMEEFRREEAMSDSPGESAPPA